MILLVVAVDLLLILIAIAIPLVLKDTYCMNATGMSVILS